MGWIVSGEPYFKCFLENQQKRVERETSGHTKTSKFTQISRAYKPRGIILKTTRQKPHRLIHN